MPVCSMSLQVTEVVLYIHYEACLVLRGLQFRASVFEGTVLTSYCGREVSPCLWELNAHKHSYGPFMYLLLYCLLVFQSAVQ